MILVTGASGFVGRALCASLLRYSPLRISVRDNSKTELLERVEIFEASISPDQDWSSALSGVSAIVHHMHSGGTMNDCRNPRKGG